MKIIDLLNKIANGEELPKKFKYNGNLFYLQYDKCYRCDEIEEIFENQFIFEDLNNEIEIIEEKKIPEKLDINLGMANMTPIEKYISNTVNEIIDYLKSKGE